MVRDSAGRGALVPFAIPLRPLKLLPDAGRTPANEGATDIWRRCHQAKISRATITISTICKSRPKIEENPPIPPKSPCPNSRPNRPAPRNPAAKPPNRPRHQKKPGWGVAWPKGAVVEGCVIERWIGAAVGAVEVLGGEE